MLRAARLAIEYAMLSIALYFIVQNVGGVIARADLNYLAQVCALVGR